MNFGWLPLLCFYTPLHIEFAQTEKLNDQNTRGKMSSKPSRAKNNGNLERKPGCLFVCLFLVSFLNHYCLNRKSDVYMPNHMRCYFIIPKQNSRLSN